MGPRPKGDPGAIQIIASTLLELSGKLAEVAGVAPGALPAYVFVGPGRAQHDHALAGVKSDALSAATELSDEATRLTAEAKDLHHRQQAWDRHKHAEEVREQQERAREAREAAGRTPQ